jgi:hypothetical protein
MKPFAILFGVVGLAAAQSYTAINLQPPGSPVYFANVIGLNNKGEVLGDACKGTCTGVNRFPAIWSNGVITALPIPSGYAYTAVFSYYGINDSGTVVGTLQVAGTNTTHVVLWTNGTPEVLQDAPIPGACSGSGCTCSTNGSSNSFGITAAGHVVGSTTYPSYAPGGPGCSRYWVYNGANFPLLPVPIPSMCTSPPLPPGYAPGVDLGVGAAITNRDVVLQTLYNRSCGPPYVNPGFPPADPVLIQPNESFSFLPWGSLSSATGTAINDAGRVLGFTSNGGGVQHLVVWEHSGVGGVFDLGPSGYGHLNQAGEVLYLTMPCIGCGGMVAIWHDAVSTPVQLPSGVDWRAFAPTAFNDAGQFVMSSGASNYLLTPTGACATDVTSQFQITRTGFRYDHSTGLFVLTGSVTNTSGSPVPGPVSLVIDNLPAGVTPVGIAGTTLCAAPQGSPYLDLEVAAGQVWPPGAFFSGSIAFTDPAQTGIPFNFRVLAGPGGR